MDNWLEWKRVNAKKIAHVAGYEEKFVDVVLSRIPGLCPADVVPQYVFFDERGKERRIDFMIINPNKGYLLPIELDGEHKPNGDIGEDWNDFLERQNDLLRSFRKLFRYSNKKMFSSSSEIIREISRELLIQESANRVQETSKQTYIELQVALKKFAEQVNRDTPVQEAYSHSSRAVWRQSLTVGAAALFATISLSYFVWQNGGRHDVSVQQTPVATTSVGMRGKSPTSVVERDVSVQETPLATASIDAREEPQITVAVPHANPSGDFILASQAQAYIGKYKQVCGHIAGSKELPAGFFINFDRPYPNAVMTAVIWHQAINRIGPLQLVENQQVCISGVIQSYLGKPQIEIERREQILP